MIDAGPASRNVAGETGGRRVSRWTALGWARWSNEALVEVAIVVAITVAAAVLRLWQLDTVPLGLHGDEAWTGIDARRVFDDGWIGPYVPSALGQPTGPLHFTALLFLVMPDDTLAVRLSMALLGVATIPLAYVAFRMMYDRTVAAIASAILAGLMWHLHLSRTGFMVTAWPLMEMAGLALLWTALRTRRPWIFVAAGVAHGLGVYSYNAYLLFVPVPFVGLAWSIARERGRRERVALAGMAAIYAAGALAATLPMVRYAADNWEVYRFHQQAVGVGESEEWKEAGVIGRADILWDRGVEWTEGLVTGDRPDLGDGLATDGHPPVQPVIILLALGGVGMALWRVRETANAVVLAALVILPWGALLTVSHGLFRRTLGLAPFVALLAALPLAWLWRRSAQRGDAIGLAGMAVVCAAVVIPGALSTREYFGPVQDDPYVRYIYPYQLDAASRYMDGEITPETRIYFYSDRWSFNYETRRFLAPHNIGEDRSLEFRPAQVSGEVDLSIDREGPVAFVFMGIYLSLAEDAAQEHPGGTMVEGERDGEVLFRAYVLD